MPDDIFENALIELPEINALENPPESNHPSIQRLLGPGLSREERQRLTTDNVESQRREIQQLERQLVKSKASLLALSAVHNALQSIRLLPDELLCDILCLACRPRLDEANEITNERDFYRPMWPSHVNQHWRKVALSTGALWTHIPLHNQPLAAQYRARSKGAPLFVQLATTSTSAAVLQNMTHTLQLCTPRTRDMRVDGDYSTLFNFVAALNRTSADILESLHLALRVDAEVETQSLERQIEFLFAKRTPQLRRVQFDTLGFPWSAAWLTSGSLTHIAVKNQRSIDLQLHDVLPILRGNPLLEEVLLSDFAALGSAIDPARVDLPHLRRLFLKNVRVDHPKFLSCLRTPARILIDFAGQGFNFGDEGHRIEDLLLVPFEEVRQLPAFSGDTVRSLYYREGTGFSTYSVSYFSSPIDLEPCTPENVPETHLQLRIAITGEREPPIRIFGALGSALRLSHLHSLRLDDVQRRPEHTDDPGAWSRVLDRFSALRVLLLARCDLQVPLHALSTAGAGFWPGQRKMRCPQLETLVIRVARDWGGYTIPKESVSLIRDCVRARAMAGMPLRGLTLGRSSSLGESDHVFLFDTQNRLAEVDEDLRAAVGPRMELDPGEIWCWKQENF